MLDRSTHPNAPDYKTKAEKPLVIVPWDEITISDGPRYLVKKVFPLSGLIVVYGPPKCGKTFWLFDIVMHIALGWEYRGRRVQQGSVVYCLFEGQDNFAARKVAFERERMAEDAEAPPFFLMPIKMELVKDRARLIDAVRHYAGGISPRVVVLDTLNRSFTGSESSDEAMTAYVAACDAIRDALGCAVVIVHHSGLVDGRARGHTALLGAADAQIGVKRDVGDNVVATVEYMKDGPDGDEIVSALRSVDVGTDKDGEAITSCIVEPAEPVIVPAGPKLTADQKTMFALLHEAGMKGLTTAEWNELARDAGIGVKRKATLVDIRLALKGKRLIYQAGGRWTVKHD